jgi:hypothetical protein
MPDGPQPIPTSIRFHADELALIDAWCAYLSADRGFKHSRSNMFRQLLQRVPPPAEKPGERVEAFKLRDAHGRAFPHTPKPEEQS